MPRLWRRQVGIAVVLGGAVFARRAAAQSPDELSAGRQLFAEALGDEEHHRFAPALEKYRRVLQIRDTAPIRYRIGSSLEGLGKTTQAVEAYTAAVRLGTGAGTDAEIVKASQTRIDLLEPKVAHLAIRVGSTAPSQEVRVDDAAVPAEGLDDVRLDPGTHVVTATAPGMRPARAQVTLSDGGRAEIPLMLEPLPPPPPPAPSPRASPLRTIGIVTGAAGVALAGTGVVFLALRSSAIGDLKASCPGGNCPAAREQDLRDTRDRAVVDGPVGGALLAVGAAAIGTGIVLYFLGRHDAKASAWVDRLGRGGSF